jgi:predicted AAA+ superfamily ATPase
LLEHCLAGRNVNHVSLDSPADRELATRDPALFLQRYPPPVLIDEVQYAPALFPHLKIEADRRKTGGLFWLTGSQQFELMRNLSETLAGRVGILKLQGLSQAELAGRTRAPPFSPKASVLSGAERTTTPLALMPLYERIWRGSFPAIATSDVSHDVFYSSYLQTYIQRDVRDLARVGDEGAFLRFVRAVAARTAQLLNMADLARDVDVDAKTIKHWLSILETSGLIYLLEPYHTNLTKRLIKAPKLYFLDTGLCSFLTRWTSPQALEAGAMSGAMFESYALSEILKSHWHNAKSPAVWFYRDKDGKEIDLLLEESGVLYPIEIKKTARPAPSMVRHFATLHKLDKPIGEGALLCLAASHLPLASDVQAVPVSYV